MDGGRKAILMAYCRLDELSEGEHPLLEELYAGAVEQLVNAGISVPEPGSGRAAQFDALVNAIVLDAWDNRGTQTEVSMPENRAFRRSLNQMKLTEPVPESGTGSAEE